MWRWDLSKHHFERQAFSKGWNHYQAYQLGFGVCLAAEFLALI